MRPPAASARSLAQWARHLGRTRDRCRRQRVQGRVRPCTSVATKCWSWGVTNWPRAVKELTRGRGAHVVYDVGRQGHVLRPRSTALRAARHDGQLRQRVRARAADRPARTGPPRLAVPDPPDLVQLHRTARGSAARRPRAVRRDRSRASCGSRSARPMPLRDVAQAHRDLQARRTVGSTVLLP